MDKKKLLMMVEIAIFAAIGLVLDQYSFKLWAQGGSISFVMLPIVLMAIRWGLVAGLATGLIIGVLQMVFGAFIVHWVQALLDYGIAFTAVGVAAVVRKPLLEATQALNKAKMTTYIVIGIFIGGFLRFGAHLLAGVVFFKEYAGDENVWKYSILYNASYMLPATILTAVIAVLLFTSAPRLLKTYNSLQQKSSASIGGSSTSN
ncbi:energy-coupled thiamine transporter ThiT [Solibacillus sp. R5-41]|uniref:energy-coupled thiamine transporter ThiT n=1 Tax=Solibacillus sp. R5-41 TaxID=2048654 RepID=UPI000C124544|nr:energy-coupled thiamine transporter ThiT [Solibacillus sp. R5-41]ATP41882.1 energy-coupled thiamine transporter ThiT [Solibacillus sp. R5-41]